MPGSTSPTRLEVAQRWLDAKGSRSKATLAAVAEVLAEDVVTPTARGKTAVLEAVRTAKGIPLFASGTWSEISDDGDMLTATCTFADGSPFYSADVFVRVGADGLITEAGTTTHAAPPGTLDRVISRVWGERRALGDLPRHLETSYGTSVSGMQRLDNGVLRIERGDAEAWVARVFPADRPLESVQSDAAVLTFLEQNDFPAERCAHEGPVTTLAGQGVLVTRFIEGKKASQSTATWRTLADLLGRLHMHTDGPAAVLREAGALHLYTVGGSVREEISTASAAMESIADRAAASPFAPAFDLVRKHLDDADDFSDLPRALIHADFHPKNALAVGRALYPIDWALAGLGPRVLSFAVFLLGVGASGSVNAQRLDAIVRAYGRHIRLEPDELDRLARAMLHRQLIFEVYGLCLSVLRGQKTWGVGAWSGDRDLCAEIAAAARAAFSAR